jgi:hypothetical protein
MGRSDVGCSATASAEGSIPMVANFSFANDLSVAISVEALDVVLINIVA